MASDVTKYEGYNYDSVIFEKGQPLLKSELNLVQNIQNSLNKRMLSQYCSGWITCRPFKTDLSLSNAFYSQEPEKAIEEYALVNGMIIKVANTLNNYNLIKLTPPPSSDSRIDGVFLEVWRVLLDDSNKYRPPSISIIDTLNDVWTDGDSFACAVGNNGIVLTTENTGLVWSRQSIDTKADINSVSFINKTYGWLVGNNGLIAHTYSSGKSWSILNFGLNNNFNDVYANSLSSIWIVGDKGIIIQLSCEGGVSWSIVNSNTTVDLNSVHFINALNGWIVGDKGTILRTTNGGKTWTRVNSGTTNNLNAVYFYNLNCGYAVGDNGTILKSCDGGFSWLNISGLIVNNTQITSDLLDITIFPDYDAEVINEDVSSQANGINKTFRTRHKPITRGDGKGITSNLRSDVKVYVNDIEVAVSGIVGSEGIVNLEEAPPACAKVTISYNFRVSPTCDVENIYIVGRNGTIIKTSDGIKWVKQTPSSAYDIYAIMFMDKNVGWLVGQNAMINYTANGGDTWENQNNDIIGRTVLRSYYEGNTGSEIFIEDNIIDPDVNVLTSKRIQIQYQIRVVENIDPFKYPDAGLGSVIVLSKGPNNTEIAKFENMGAINGDYGLYRAECPETVDGYSWAIPIAVVARRNTLPYDETENANGSYVSGTSSERPDFLTAYNVYDGDILDVRRKIIFDIKEIFSSAFYSLMQDNLRTNFDRNLDYGDQYGTLLLHTDEFETSDLPISSNVKVIDGNKEIDSDELEFNYTKTLSELTDINEINGILHWNPIYFSAVYKTDDEYNGKPVPGYFSGFGTDTLTFHRGPNSKAENGKIKYIIKFRYIRFNTNYLKYQPVSPKVVRLISSSGASTYFKGVFENKTAIVDQWNIYPEKTSYVKVYGDIDYGNGELLKRGSTVELHLFIKVTDNILDPNDNTILYIGFSNLGPDINRRYNVGSILKIVNLTSKFSYKIKNIYKDIINNRIVVKVAEGFIFMPDTELEIIIDTANQSNISNGASVNFSTHSKEIGTFFASLIITKDNIGGTSFNSINYDFLGAEQINSGEIIGFSTCETLSSLTQQVAWVSEAGGITKMYPVKVTKNTATKITVDFYDWDENGNLVTKSFISTNTTVTFQILVKINTLKSGSLRISYLYTPYQCVSELPDNLKVEPVLVSDYIYISNLGYGGSNVLPYPFKNPLKHIPVNDISILDDNKFFNIEPLRFSNFYVDGGFVQLPVYIPSDKDELTLSEPMKDNQYRYFYSKCSREFYFMTEGLMLPSPRKIFIPVLAKIKESPDERFIKGEYVLMIVSKNNFIGTENYTGYKESDKNVIAIYRLPFKPISRI